LAFPTAYNVLKYVARASLRIAFALVSFWLLPVAFWFLLDAFSEDTALVSACSMLSRQAKLTPSVEHLDEELLCSATCRLYRGRI
jgi:hypothetical protein